MRIGWALAAGSSSSSSAAAAGTMMAGAMLALGGINHFVEFRW